MVTGRGRRVKEEAFLCKGYLLLFKDVMKRLHEKKERKKAGISERDKHARRLPWELESVDLREERDT